MKMPKIDSFLRTKLRGLWKGDLTPCKGSGVRTIRDLSLILKIKFNSHKITGTCSFHIETLEYRFTLEGNLMGNNGMIIYVYSNWKQEMRLAMTIVAMLDSPQKISGKILIFDERFSSKRMKYAEMSVEKQ